MTESELPKNEFQEKISTGQKFFKIENHLFKLAYKNEIFTLHSFLKENPYINFTKIFDKKNFTCKFFFHKNSNLFLI